MSDLQTPAPLWCTPTAMHSEPNDASDEKNNNGHDHHDYSLAQRAVFYLCCVCLLSAKVAWGLLSPSGCGWQVVGGGQWLVVGELVVELVAVVGTIVHQRAICTRQAARGGLTTRSAPSGRSLADKAGKRNARVVHATHLLARVSLKPKANTMRPTRVRTDPRHETLCTSGCHSLNIIVTKAPTTAANTMKRPTTMSHIAASHTSL
jgi:hypothetical protein